jgi:hypothetical protein
MSHETPLSLENTGSYHAATRRAAAALTGNGTTGATLILSAKYGLVTLDRVIEPYDLRAGQPGAVTAQIVRAQAGTLGILDAEVTVLAGRAYASIILEVWPQAADMLAGTRGIGQQLARLVAGERPPRLRSASPPPRTAGSPP